MTEPDGVPLVEVTVAVKVTDWPEFDGFGVEATVVDVAKLVWLIVSVRLPLLFAHPVDPVKLAPMVWLPVASDAVVKVAMPLVTVTFEAKVVAPSVKVTLPIGVPPELVTVAVNVTLCPCDAGFDEDVTLVEVAAMV